MKFGQLIEHNMRNIFRLKSYTKYGGEIIPIIKHIVSVVCQVVDYWNILILSYRPLAFLKTKRVLELFSLSHFLYDF